MPLHDRPIAIKCAVASFFGVCIVGLCQGVAPETCSQRGVLGAVVVYLVVGLVVKAINAILMQAIVTRWIDQQKEQTRDE